MLSNQPIFSPQEYEPSVISLSSSSQAWIGARSPLQSALAIGKEVDHQAGVTEYYDEETNQCLSYEDYWTKKEFEAQPFYRLGQFIRETVSELADWVSTIWTDWSQTVDEEPTNCKPYNELITNGINQDYEAFSLAIDAAKERATEHNKPLLILVGETHLQLNSLLNTAKILNIAKNKLDMTFALTESFISSCYDDETAKFIMLQEKMIAHFKLNKVPMDYALCSSFKLCYLNCQSIESYYPQISHGTSSQHSSMVIRDKVMASFATQFRTDIVAIVGAYHLQGLMASNDLINTFEILSINVHSFPWSPLETRFPSYESCMKRFSHPHKARHCFAHYSSKVLGLPKIAEEQELREIEFDCVLSKLKKR